MMVNQIVFLLRVIYLITHFKVMGDKIYLFVIGTAGCGKSYFTKAFSDYLDVKRIDHAIVNLDPGADFLPYIPDVDVREWFTTADIMEKYRVGPNGAQIISADLIATKAGDMVDELDLYSAEYVIIDTPGQMELFTFRTSSEIVINEFGKNSSVGVYLFDPVISQRPSGFISMIFMYSSSVFRLKIPQIPALSKIDMLSEHVVERIVEWSKDPDRLHTGIMEERDLSGDLFYMMREAGLIRPVVPVSSLTGAGMDDVYEMVQEIFYGGEDLESLKY